LHSPFVRQNCAFRIELGQLAAHFVVAEVEPAPMLKEPQQMSPPVQSAASTQWMVAPEQVAFVPLTHDCAASDSTQQVFDCTLHAAPLHCTTPGVTG
jgi:hypothetical protein